MPATIVSPPDRVGRSHLNASKGPEAVAGRVTHARTAQRAVWWKATLPVDCSCKDCRVPPTPPGMPDGATCHSPVASIVSSRQGLELL
jgi:hypothetical protein